MRYAFNALEINNKLILILNNSMEMKDRKIERKGMLLNCMKLINPSIVRIARMKCEFINTYTLENTEYVIRYMENCVLISMPIHCVTRMVG